MKKLALIGSARPKYNERLETILKKYGYSWSGWSFKLDAVKERILNEQINDKNIGYFYIYVHDIQHPDDEDKFGTGTGYIEYRLRVEKFDYDDNLHWSPDPKCTPKLDAERQHRLYGYITKKPEQIIPHKKYYEFINFDTGKSVSKFFPFFGKTVRNKEFIYVIEE
jgi:hypothetical protein